MFYFSHLQIIRTDALRFLSFRYIKATHNKYAYGFLCFRSGVAAVFIILLYSSALLDSCPTFRDHYTFSKYGVSISQQNGDLNTQVLFLLFTSLLR